MTMAVGRTTFKATDNEVVVEIVSSWGHKDVFTVTTDGYALVLQAQHYDKDGEPTDDGMALVPAGRNTVKAYVG